MVMWLIAIIINMFWLLGSFIINGKRSRASEEKFEIVKGADESAWTR